MNKTRLSRVAAAALAAVSLVVLSACSSGAAPVASPSGGMVSVLPDGVSLSGPSGSPAPQPLAQQQTIKVGVFSKLETVAPVLLADAEGEFQKENLKVEFVYDTPPNLFTLLGQGKIDVVQGGTTGLVFNALRQGVPVRWLSGLSQSPQDSGLYLSTKIAASSKDFQPAQIKGAKIAVNPGGLSSPAAYPIYSVLQKAGLNPGDVTLQVFNDKASMVQALNAGSVDGAIIGPPFTSALTPGVAFWAEPAYPDDIQIAGYYGTSILTGTKSDVGEAFFRAILRTVNTYLTGDYHKNADTVATLAKVLDSTPQIITSTPAITFDFNVPEKSVGALQDMYATVPNTLQYDNRVTPDELVDLSLVLQASGH
ncbi:ABC transporter substrate-binding protein [Microbacterium sp. X-17]|uniref:ABC transporter substrate-binding protein n=1 Tax=Microbacterium sp. X-17 TaxID=3144404 RepID=UPI0031F523AC